MTRKAKIIATLGNSTEGLLEDIVAKGADAVLIDTYYGDAEECVSRINKIKELNTLNSYAEMENLFGEFLDYLESGIAAPKKEIII